MDPKSYMQPLFHVVHPQNKQEALVMMVKIQQNTYVLDFSLSILKFFKRLMNKEVVIFHLVKNIMKFVSLGTLQVTSTLQQSKKSVRHPNAKTSL